MPDHNSHPYKLQSIELKDFKSIAHAKVDFQPLTVIVGANSSGKSSLLQAILALSQTVRSGDQTGRFVLNRELIRLGTFEETKNLASKDPDSPIQITTVIRTEHRVSDRALWVDSTYASWSLHLTSGESSNYNARIGSIEFKVSKYEKHGGPGSFLDLADTLANKKHPNEYPSKDILHPLAACYLTNIKPKLQAPERIMFVPVPDEIKGAPLLKVSGQFTDWNPWWWQITNEPFEDNGVGPFGDAAETYNCDAAVMIGGIPLAVYTKRSRINSYAYCWWDHVIDFLHVYISTPGKNWTARANADTLAVDYAEDWIRTYERDKAAKTKSSLFNSPSNDLKDLGSYIKDENAIELSEPDRDRIADSMGQLGEAEFRRLLQERFEKEEWATEESLDESEQSESGLGKGIEGSKEVQDFFNKSIRYLGPLRAAPRSLHNLSTNQLDIGINGEYVAAVLHTNADQEVLLPEVGGSSRHTDLKSALEYWLHQFGMTDSIHTEDWGRLGISLKVFPPAMKESVDLTSVGVGVSQILPVIVLCLLAEPGDLVILEQPELHLHPALQQELADFLLECTRSGRQVLVETHSEHLINRLRRRVTEDESNATQSLVGLSFAEQHDGRTTFRASEINTYGGLSEDWPDGFLDLGAREAQSLVRNSLDKRRRMLDREGPPDDLEKDGSKP